MPPTQGKKTVSQAIPEPVTEPIQSSAIVVIHPGSAHLRLGRAADAFPRTIPHCIARRHKNVGAQHQTEDSWLVRKACKQVDSGSIQRHGLRKALEALQYRPMGNGQYRDATDHKQLAEVHTGIVGEMSDVMSPVSWTTPSDQQSFVIGEEALYIGPNEPYDLRWPIRRGKLNLHSGAGGSLTAVLQDLCDLWSTSIQNHLDIPIKDLKHYRAALLIPDIFNHQHVRELLSLLLTRLGFAAAFVVQESACASFGTGVSSACVVDIGDQKTAVCCVEDGLSLKNTRICMDFGGSDVTRCFHWLLTRSGFPYKECNLVDRVDALLLQELKETYCHLDQDVQGYKEAHLQLKRPGEKIHKFTIQMGDERILAALSVFYPDMFGLSKATKSVSHVPEEYRSDPTDPFDEQYIVQTRSKHEQAARALAQKRKEASGVDVDGETIEDDDNMESENIDQNSKASEGMGEVAKLGLIGLDQAILQSIDKCESDDMKKRMYSCVLVVGGGLMFPLAQSWLQYLIWTRMPGTFRLQLETQDIITNPKDMDPRQTCWKGCAIMCCLDTSQELWIRQREWKQYGIKVLRERAPFLWTD